MKIEYNSKYCSEILYFKILQLFANTQHSRLLHLNCILVLLEHIDSLHMHLFPDTLPDLAHHSSMTLKKCPKHYSSPRSTSPTIFHPVRLINDLSPPVLANLTFHLTLFDVSIEPHQPTKTLPIYTSPPFAHFNTLFRPISRNNGPLARRRRSSLPRRLALDLRLQQRHRWQTHLSSFRSTPTQYTVAHQGLHAPSQLFLRRSIGNSSFHLLFSNTPPSKLVLHKVAFLKWI